MQGFKSLPNESWKEQSLNLVPGNLKLQYHYCTTVQPLEKSLKKNKIILYNETESVVSKRFHRRSCEVSVDPDGSFLGWNVSNDCRADVTFIIQGEGCEGFGLCPSTMESFATQPQGTLRVLEGGKVTDFCPLILVEGFDPSWFDLRTLPKSFRFISWLWPMGVGMSLISSFILEMCWVR